MIDLEDLNNSKLKMLLEVLICFKWMTVVWDLTILTDLMVIHNQFINSMYSLDLMLQVNLWWMTDQSHLRHLLLVEVDLSGSKISKLDYRTLDLECKVILKVIIYYSNKWHHSTLPIKILILLILVYHNPLCLVKWKEQ